MSHKEDVKIFVFGAILGGVIGSLTALLLAPKAGKKLREDIAEKWEEGISAFTEKKEEIKEDIAEAFERRSKQEGREGEEKTKKDKISQNINDIADWLLVGATLLEKFKSRRKK
jgi:gas vesicle protein